MARSFVRIAVLGAALASLGSGSVEAQSPSVSVSGVVVAIGGSVIEGAQVSIPGTGLGVLTDAAGRFLLSGVPSGPATLEISHIGYRPVAVAVNPDGSRITLGEVALTERAIRLDEIVVSGTAIPSQRRQVANAVGRVDADQVRVAPVPNVSAYLQGRVPGVAILPGSGATGDGAKIRIRGSASIGLSNEPIVYVDGIRIDGSAGTATTQGARSSRLDDINPESIERIEILRGAAAATLYGSEASNGVIQIFTKRGQSGAPRWSIQVEQGTLSMPTNRVIPHADFAAAYCFGNPSCVDQNTERIQEFWGVSPAPYEVFERDQISRAFETGYRQSYGLTLSGGRDDLTYFISGRYANEDGAFGLEELGPAKDTNTKRQATLSLSLAPTEHTTLSVTALYGLVDHQAPINNNDVLSTMARIFQGQLRLSTDEDPFGEITNWGTVRESLHIENTQSAENLVLGTNFGATLPGNVGLRAGAGLNASTEQGTYLRPFGWNVDGVSAFPDARGASTRSYRETTYDVALSREDIGLGSITLDMALGSQGYFRNISTRGAGGIGFPAPGLEVTTALGTQNAIEDAAELAGLGAYGQTTLGWRDGAFLTVGGRLDKSSAFGAAADAAFYPKLGLSVLPQDAFGWDWDAVSTFRVRAAVGRSGLQPAVIATTTTLVPVASANGPGLIPSGLGNPDLKPEEATELEAGLELGLWDDRMAIEATYWDRTVRDALVRRGIATSTGFSEPQFANVGRIESSGLELSVRGLAVDRERITFEVFANGAYLTETIASLGGLEPSTVGGSYTRYRNGLQQGFAPGAFFGAVLDDAAIPLDLEGTCTAPSEAEALAYFEQPRVPWAEVTPLLVGCGGDQVMNHYLGKPMPDWQGSFGGRFGLGANLEFAALFEYKAGSFFAQDLSGAFRRSVPGLGLNTPAAAQVHATLMDPNSSSRQRLDAALEWTRLRGLFPFAGLNEVYRADFVRWREATLSYRLPVGLSQRLGATSTRVTLAARNLALWMNSAYPGLDPEINVVSRCVSDSALCNFGLSTEMWGMPIPRQFTLTVRAEF